MKLKSFDEAVWFDYPDEPGVKFQIRSTPTSVTMEIRDKIRKAIPFPSPNENPNRPQIVIVNDLDPLKFSFELFDHALVDWTGIEVEGVKDKIQIKKAIFNYQPFSIFIMEKMEELTNLVSGRIEAEIKNLSSSQDG